MLEFEVCRDEYEAEPFKEELVELDEAYREPASEVILTAALTGRLLDGAAASFRLGSPARSASVFRFVTGSGTKFHDYVSVKFCWDQESQHTAHGLVLECVCWRRH